MAWWCSALQRPFDWTPRPYLGVWLFCSLLVAGYVALLRRHAARTGSPAATRRQRWQFAGGIVALWIASDWPVGTLGGGYLSSIHMLQYMLYTLAAAPLLMLGTPDWLARAVLTRLRIAAAWKVLTRPVVAVLVSNGLLIATHAPYTVDLLRSSQLGSFALDMVWLVSGLIMWSPIIDPLREYRLRSAPIKLVYLFAAAALMPMIPGGFLVFADHPLYATYEMAPRVGISALHDQQLAGVLMKIGNLPVIWTVMGVIFFRWYETDQRHTARRRRVTNRPALKDGEVASKPRAVQAGTPPT